MQNNFHTHDMSLFQRYCYDCVNIDTHVPDHQSVIILPTGDYDQHKTDLTHVLQLERLGSLYTDATYDETCLIFSSSTSRSQTLDVPVSPPYYRTTRNILHYSQSTDGRESPFPSHSAVKHQEIDGRSCSLRTQLWSPYVLSQNISPQGNEKIQEVSFTHQVLYDYDKQYRVCHSCVWL